MTDLTVPLHDGRTLTTALMRPAGEPPEAGWPGVLIVHEVFGLTPEIRAVGDTFAGRGWAAAVPDLFSSGQKLGCLVKTMREATSGAPSAVTEDLREALTWLGRQDGVDPARTAVIGFCLGGAFALLLGSLGPEGLQAVSDNYGAPPAATTDLTRCPPVIGSYGENDRVLGAKAVATLQERLTAGGVEHDVTRYPGAAHGFLTADHKLFGIVPLPGTAYVESAASPAWKRIFAFLEERTAA